jgi:acyl-CoA synthetase (AMP-forming)/AMP-acid ligase II/aryl carrier-like protein
MAQFETLRSILSDSAREDRHLTFIDGDDEQRVLSFARLRQRALGLLGALQSRGLRPGHAMVLCVADNERFLEMFWACVFGGMVPVPLAPISGDEQRRKLFRVFAQFDSASAYIDAAALERLDGFIESHGLGAEGQRLRECALIPGSLDLGTQPGRPWDSQPEDLAFIQYSSGSTGDPKGVMLTHRNLIANLGSIREAAAFSDRDVALSWMPLSHDMGLIGFHLNMLACGVSHLLMRTDLFARRPLMWLDQASRRKATVLCSPNFGYQHYLKQYALKQPEGLDLSSVRLVFNGAEPISADLARRFVRTMEPHGLKPSCMFAVYGLAEASLAVSFPRPGSALETLHLPRSGLSVGARVTAVLSEAEGAAEFVKLGWPVPGTEVRISDESGVGLGEQVLGRVQIRGDNVTRGYYRDETKTTECISPEGWLDTGDLGLVWGGQLVVTGRAKDLVIVNGQNHYPQDLERVAEQVAGIEANRVAAASVSVLAADAEELALFVIHRGDLNDFVPKVLELRRKILQHTGLQATHVVPLKQIPKTSSGKLQRYALAQAFEQGEFEDVLAELEPLLRAAGAEQPPEGEASTTVRRLLEVCALFVTDRELTPQTNLLEINLNSLTLARIHEAIEREFPQRVDVADLFDYPTLEQLAEFLNRSS